MLAPGSKKHEFPRKLTQEVSPKSAGILSWLQASLNTRMLIEVRDSRSGYLIPARDGPGALPDVESSWDAAVAAAAVSCQNVTLISFSFRA